VINDICTKNIGADCKHVSQYKQEIEVFDKRPHRRQKSQLAHSPCTASPRTGIEPATSSSQIRRLTRRIASVSFASGRHISCIARWILGSTQSQGFSMGRKSTQNCPICPLPWGDPDPRLIHGYLGPPHPTRHVDRAIRLFRAHAPLSLYFTMGWSLPHPKLPFSLRGSRPPSNTWLLWLTPPHMPNDISISPAVFAGYLVVTSQTHRQTDRTTHQ